MRSRAPLAGLAVLGVTLGSLVTAAVADAGTVMHRQASAGWHVVFTHHYGAAANYSGYTAVAVPGKADAWAFGSTNIAGEPAPGTPVAEQWNGTSWRGSTLPSGLSSEIDAASVVSTDSVWAVTETGGDVLHWNGSQWSVAEVIPGTGTLLLTGITAVSDSDVWVFGTAAVGPGYGTWHFNGHTWTQVTGPGGTVSSASAVSARDIWAVGATSSGPAGNALEHYDGTSWSYVSATALTGLEFSSVLALSGTDVWATASSSSGAAELLHFNGTQWTSTTSPYSGVSLTYMAPDGQGGFWFDNAGAPGKTSILHYSAAGVWSRITLSTGDDLYPVALIPGTTSLWGVGWIRTKTDSNAAIWAYGPAA
jgi:hypothetical protein